MVLEQKRSQNEAEEAMPPRKNFFSVVFYINLNCKQTEGTVELM